MTKLRNVLEGYDTWMLPNPGDPGQLSKDQRAANLAHVLAIKDSRIAALRAALPEIDEHLGTLLDGAVHPLAAVHALNRWWVDAGLQLSLFPPVAGGLKSKLFPNRHYAANAVLANARWYEWPDHPLVAPLDTLLRDMALIVGDAIVLRRPDFAWAINEDPSDRRSKMKHWGRVVVMRTADASWPAQAFDLFDLARWSYSNLHNLKRQKAPLEPVDVGGGDWRGPFLGWTAVQVINGGFTPDHYPQGRNGPPASGRWITNSAA